MQVKCYIETETGKIFAGDTVSLYTTSGERMNGVITNIGMVGLTKADTVPNISIIAEGRSTNSHLPITVITKIIKKK